MKPLHAALFACAAALPLTTQADTFGSGAFSFTIDFATIGNPGNPNDRGLDQTDDTPGDLSDDEYARPTGGVGYVYRMAVTEVPWVWYFNARNSGMTNAPSGPTTMLPAETGWIYAAVLVNWLNTSTGHQAAYDLTWTGSAWTMDLWSSEEAWQADGENLFRHKDAFYFLPSEAEWYKAAYHKNDGVTGNYWDYATGSNVPPTRVPFGTMAGTAVYDWGLGFTRPAVDNNGGLSPYGTRGQNGNANEWLESAADSTNDSVTENRSYRGGDYISTAPIGLASGFRGIAFGDPIAGGGNIGVRIASIPEPGSAALLVAVFPMLLRRRRR